MPLLISTVVLFQAQNRETINTLSQKNPCDYVFDDNLNSKRPIVIIFGTVITQTIGRHHRKVVSLSHFTYFVQLPYPGNLFNLKIRRFSPS